MCFFWSNNVTLFSLGRGGAPICGFFSRGPESLAPPLLVLYTTPASSRTHGGAVVAMWSSRGLSASRSSLGEGDCCVTPTHTAAPHRSRCARFREDKRPTRCTALPSPCPCSRSTPTWPEAQSRPPSWPRRPRRWPRRWGSRPR